MNLHSLKTRFIGSYLILLALFVIQVPIIYLLVGGMGEKYPQVDKSGALRKRAVEMTEVLNRHIMTGDERLEKVFQDRKKEYGEAIDNLRNGTEEVAAIKDQAVLAKLSALEQKWFSMRTLLDKAMESGDALRESKIEIEAGTSPMVGKLNALLAELGGRFTNAAGLQRMRTVKLSYLFERYITSFDDRAQVRAEIDRTVSEFDAALRKLGTGVRGAKATAAFGAVEEAWNARKEQVLGGVKASDEYQSRLTALIDVNTPEIVGAAAEVTHLLAANARGDAFRAIVIMAVSVLVSAVLAIFFMFLANSQLIRPITRVKETVEAFARGDLTKRAGIRIRFLGRELDDEVVGLGRSVDAMASQMSDVIGRITDSSSLLASASEQLSASSTQIAGGADRQSSQTVQVATSMEEMNATVIEVARNSQQASESAREAQTVAGKGGEVVTQAITAMQEV
ncbi:MAG: methyl-accepting chemotaxis protein, partial [Thermodesulfobacteriota bacterium]